MNALTLAFNMILPSVIEALKRDDVPMPQADAVRVAEQVAAKVAPVIVSQANQEPWYQSRVTWGALLSIATGIAALFGIVISPEDIELFIGIAMAAGTVIGGAITLYGRWKAKKPIGQ